MVSKKNDNNTQLMVDNLPKDDFIKSILSVDDNNKEDIINEIQNIYIAIKNNDIVLSSEEKDMLLKDIQIIWNEMGYSEEQLENCDLDYNSNRNVFQDVPNVSSEQFNSNKNDNLVDESFHNNQEFITDNNISNNIDFLENENSLEVHSFPDNQNVDDVDVDELLDDLIDDYSGDKVIKVNHLYMDYKLSKDKIDTFKEFFIRTLKRNKKKTKTVNALKDISFEISKGDRVGIIGFNGAGKSTLLKLLAGIYDPTSGTIEIKGKIAPLLELGAGFDNNYTGKANIFLNGAFLGYSEDFLKEKYDEIVEFSELGEAINYHIKTYSSGMRAKLGFSIATIVEPDILIIDEILSVGDIKFRRKSADKIKSLINSGVTVLLVSHSVAQIRDLCNKAIWIDNGELRMMGDVNEVCDEYVEAASIASKDQLKNIDLN